ncbi:hypothetical protein AAFF_G00150980 [Aldrovandia affinis]|uniref:G-protein coupled receptors family 1 profile domain-containing protein n=1 Tax=Aldrovandia affinis TaxID=143900 RepID=A0AAD7VX94_9TELE|nr:hypothetical protein AAFF_G00150980 [Aldrovandia affinis]
MQTVGLIHTLEQCLNRMQTVGLIHTLEQCLNRMQSVGLIHTLEQCLNRMQTVGLIHTLEQCLNRMQTVGLIHSLEQCLNNMQTLYFSFSFFPCSLSVCGMRMNRSTENENGTISPPLVPAEHTIEWHSFISLWPEAFWIYFFAHVSNILVGLPINVWVLWLIVRGLEGVLASEIFTLNLAALELIYCLHLPLALLNYLVLNSILSKTSLFFYGLIIFGRPLFQCCTCVERYLAVLHPLTFLRSPGLGEGEGQGPHLAKKRAFRIITVSLVFTLANYLPLIVASSLQDHVSYRSFYIVYGTCYSISVFCSFVQPLYFLSRAGKLQCIMGH